MTEGQQCSLKGGDSREGERARLVSPKEKKGGGDGSHGTAERSYSAANIIVALKY